jgi:hypothetical protein
LTLFCCPATHRNQTFLEDVTLDKEMGGETENSKFGREDPKELIKREDVSVKETLYLKIFLYVHV